MQETIQIALENLEKNTGLKARWKRGKVKEGDGELDIQVGEKLMKFMVEAKRELRNHNLPNVLEQAGGRKDFMVVANRILPGVKEALRQNHIAYLEGNGNIFIDKKPVFVWLDNNKPLAQIREKPNRAFTKAGLQVIFLFLIDPTYINQTFRNIADAADTALGNVNNVIHGLLEQGFLVRKNKKEFLLNNKKALLEKWIMAYEEKLKPVLFVGNFRFLNIHTEKNWKEINLNVRETVWGGEPGGDILTHHLRPETLTVYTKATQKELMLDFRIMPDTNGNLKFYKKFWKVGQRTPEAKPKFDVEKAAPPILVYADLMNTNNKRCIETAQIIYERFIEPDI